MRSIHPRTWQLDAMGLRRPRGITVALGTLYRIPHAGGWRSPCVVQIRARMSRHTTRDRMATRPDGVHPPRWMRTEVDAHHHAHHRVTRDETTITTTIAPRSLLSLLEYSARRKFRVFAFEYGNASWALEFGGRNGFPPPEKNELVLSIEMGCVDTMLFQSKPNTLF